jgi:glycosyltransferase involved in cell wall biosynthesis
MRIALLVDTTAFAGTERHVLDLARTLQSLWPAEHARDITLAIACPHKSPLAERARDLNLTTLPLPAQQGVFPSQRTIRVLRRWLVAGRFDLLHVHNGSTALHATLAVGLARRGRVVMTQHFLDPAHTSHAGIKARMFGIAHRLVNERVAHFIAVSNATQKQMLARGDAPQDHITVIPNALYDPDARSLTPPAAVREALGCAPSTPLVMCAARLESEKSLEVLIGAMAILKARGIAARCVVAGEGAQRESLEAQIRELKVEDSVQLLGFRSDVLALMRAADIFALPSREEPFGLVLLEAMALEKPVVASDAGGPREIVVHGETGVLVPPDDCAALANALQTLIADDALRARFGQAGRARFLTHFQSESMACAVLAVYRRALGND